MSIDDGRVPCDKCDAEMYERRHEHSVKVGKQILLIRMEDEREPGNSLCYKCIKELFEQYYERKDQTP